MRGWSFKKDAEGRPRRFLGHGEAALWSLRSGAVVAGVFAAPVLFRSLLDLVGPVDGPPFNSLDLVIPAMIWATASLLLYLYIALSGGVMDREARRRYRNGETSLRR